MAVNTKHPSYINGIEDVELVRDAYEGERVVKQKGQRYLKPTPGHELDGMGPSDSGYKAYESYKDRANFPDYVEQAVISNVGMICQKPALFQIPESMEYLKKRAGFSGESLDNLLRKIYEELLTTGRVGLLADISVKNPDKPEAYISWYSYERILNWDEQDNGVDIAELTYVGLDESRNVMDENRNWRLLDIFRVCQLNSNGDYATAEFESGEEVSDFSLNVPKFKGRTLKKIPFTFINTKDLIPEPDRPPLLGVARLSFSIYRSDADYRHTLFMQGQETLVVINGRKSNLPGEETRVGAGAKLDVDIGGDAKYIGVTAAGLSEQRIAIENDKAQAEAKAGQLVNPNHKVEESGQALHTRMSAQTSNLHTIAVMGFEGLLQCLKHIAEWVGENPDEVTGTPNTEFSDVVLDGQQLVQVMTARGLGAPISYESIHEGMRKRSMTEKTYEDEIELIAKEDLERAERMAKLPLPPVPASSTAIPFNPKPGNAPSPGPVPKSK